MCVLICSPTSRRRILAVPHPGQHLVFPIFFHFRILICVEYYLISVFKTCFIIYWSIVDLQSCVSDVQQSDLVVHIHTDSIPGSERSPGGEHGNLFQYSCLEKPMDRRAWWATVRGVEKSWFKVYTHLMPTIRANTLLIKQICYNKSIDTKHYGLAMLGIFIQ